MLVPGYTITEKSPVAETSPSVSVALPVFWILKTFCTFATVDSSAAEICVVGGLRRRVSPSKIVLPLPVTLASGFHQHGTDPGSSVGDHNLRRIFQCAKDRAECRLPVYEGRS
jgi:hypothetical protein